MTSPHWLSRWTAYDAEPVATHRLEALNLGQTELALRDGHQSLLATRMALEDMARSAALSAADFTEFTLNLTPEAPQTWMS